MKTAKWTKVMGVESGGQGYTGSLTGNDWSSMWVMTLGRGASPLFDDARMTTSVRRSTARLCKMARGLVMLQE